MLAESADRFAALEQGLSLLSYGDATKAGLIRKLRRRGISAEIAEASAEQLAARGYIDECAQIERFLRNELRKGRGARRILAAAREKGYGDEAVARLRDRLAEIDFAEVCAAVIDKKWGTLPTACDARQKAVAALLRLGFSLGEIQSAVRASASKAD